MIGDAYFQLRAQFGTALFSLLRLAVEAGAEEATLAALRAAQSSLRECLLVSALGPSGSGKSTLLNTLFEREFCGAAEPVTAGKIAVFRHGVEARDQALSPMAVECARPHRFLRDFTVVDTPDLASLDRAAQADLTLFIAGVEVNFFVAPAAPGASVNDWEFLRHLGRDVLGRTVFVVWQNDRVSPDEAANAMKRLRQAMLKSLGVACPIFAASEKDAAGREKLTRWIESEVIFSDPRRARLAEIGRLARKVLREIAGKPHAAEQAWLRTEGQLRELRENLAEREEQSQRQIAGLLWTLAQSFDVLRQRGESLLHAHLRLAALLLGRHEWRSEVAGEIETQARESLAVQAQDVFAALGADLQHAAAEYRQECRAALPENATGEAPPLPPPEMAATIQQLETPLELERTIAESAACGAVLLRLPVLAVAGAVAVTLGAWPVAGLIWESAALALGAGAFVLLLAQLVRKMIIADFGRHFTANRATLIGAIEPALRQASEQFYRGVARPLEARIAAHSAGRRPHEPLLTRIQQLEQTFGKIAGEMRTGHASDPPPREAP